MSDNGTIKEFSLYISKVSVEKSLGGVMHWRANASDTSQDLYDESMSKELYADFIYRIEKNLPVPKPFDGALGEDWRGGMPYISLSHYKSGTNFKNVPGMPEKIYMDGDILKAVGTLHDNPLGRAVFKSLCDDLYSEKAKTEGKIRISIGFLDLEHKHLGEGISPDYLFTRKGLEDKCPMCQEGTGRKVYMKGQLVHLALTRVPVNPRTTMEVSKAMTIETKKEDAESIIGKELSDTLEEKSLLSDVLVTKSDDVEIVEEAKHPDSESIKEDKKDKTSEKDEEKKPAKKDVKKEMSEVEKAKIAADKQSEEFSYEEDDEQKREERRNRPAGEKSILQKSFDEIEGKLVEMKSQGVPAETALREIQPLYSAFGETIKKSVQPELAVQMNSEISELTSIVKSLAETVSTLQQTMSTELATLKAQTLTTKSAANSIPVPRSLSGANLPVAQPTRQLTQIEQLAYKSTQTR